MNPTIAIGLGTKDRPVMLEQALASLKRLKLPENTGVELIVCDNDEQGKSRQIVTRHQDEFPFTIHYINETSNGIVFMRNAILTEAFKIKASFLAFFDDDEVVDEDWLINLNNTRLKFSADIVQGHVKQLFPEVSNLEMLGKFFPGSFDNNTGDELEKAYTNNVLFDLKPVEELNLKFNKRFNMTGGSDSFFFSQLKEVGAKIVFCKEAIVTETVPESRATIEWILARVYRNGYTNYLMEVERFGKVSAFWRGIKVTTKVMACYFHKNKKVDQLTEKDIIAKRKCLRARGKFDAMFGVPFTEYHITHGN